MLLFPAFSRHSTECNFGGVSIVASLISLSLGLVALTVVAQIVGLAIAYTFRGKHRFLVYRAVHPGKIVIQVKVRVTNISIATNTKILHPRTLQAARGSMLRRRCSDFPYLNRLHRYARWLGTQVAYYFQSCTNLMRLSRNLHYFEQVDVGRRTACRLHYYYL